MYSFGSGVLMGVRSDISNQTPINFGLVQEVSLDFSFNTKELYGQYQFPLAIARGTGKFTGKAKVARFSAYAFNDLFFGMSGSAGQAATSFAEAGTVPTTPYQITVAHSATFVDDFGVIDATTGLPLVKVASSPATGQYSVSAGVYTFAAADAATTVLISYTYTTTGGRKFTVSNQLLGTTPTFQGVFYTTFQGKQFTCRIINGVSKKLSLATKLEDFVMPDFEFDCFANAAGTVCELGFGEVS